MSAFRRSKFWRRAGRRRSLRPVRALPALLPQARVLTVLVLPALVLPALVLTVLVLPAHAQPSPAGGGAGVPALAPLSAAAPASTPSSTAVSALTPLSSAAPTSARLSTAAPTEWTFALYANADNDLDYTWERFTLPALKQIPASSGLNVVVLLDRRRSKRVEMLQISGGAVRVVATFPEKDMGGADTFRWFLDLVERMFPSRHLAVCAWDHGNAWHYFSHDYRSGSRIRMAGLSRAIRRAAVPIDILAFDCCNMAAIEVAYQAAITGRVRYFVSSEETIDQDGFPYGMMLTPLAADPSRTPQNVVRDMVGGWTAYYRPLRWANWVNLVGLDVRAVRAAKTHLRRWSERLRALLPVNRRAYRRALSRTYHTWDSDYVDVVDLCRRLLQQSAIRDVELRTRTRQVSADISSAVLAVSNGSAARHLRGLTIWWPDGRSWRRERGVYRRTAFAAPSHWASFLAAYCTPGATAPELVQPHQPLGLSWLGGPPGAPLATGYDNDTATALALRSNDGGSPWRKTSRKLTSYALYAAASPGGVRWWAVGGDAADGRGLIVASTNGGRTWTRQRVNVARYLFDVHMTDSRNGWIVGSSGLLLHTTSGGRDPDGKGPRRGWERVSAQTRAWLWGVEFLDAARGWAVGTLPPYNSGVILQTATGGADPDGAGPATAWVTVPSPAAGGLFDIAVRPSGAAWAVGGHPGGGGSVVHAADGVTWVTQSVPPAGCLNGVHFIDDRNGWVVGNDGTILHTANGGATWERQGSGVLFDLYDVRFTHAAHGMAVGDAGVLLVTEDGGATWEPRPVIIR